MDKKKQTVLITGGEGLIGSEVALRYKNRGDDVYTWDTRINPYNDYSKVSTYNLCEVFPTINDLLKIKRFDIISHHAAMVGVGQSQYRIDDYFANNVNFTAKLLQAIAEHKNFPNRLILAGSMGPYGEGKYSCHACLTGFYYQNPRETIDIICPVCGENLGNGHRNFIATSESFYQYPQSMYAITKKTQEDMFRTFAHAYGVDTVSLRYFSVYATDSNPHNPYTGVLSIIANKLINSKQIDLYEDGMQTRDLIHVSDVADAHLAATQYMKIQKKFEAINIGTGTCVTLLDVASKMKQQVKSKKQIVLTNTLRSGDIKNQVADITKAKRMLNWMPKIDIATGIEAYCGYIETNWKSFIGVDTTLSESAHLDNIGLLKGN